MTATLAKISSFVERDLDNDFWRFSLSFYARADVAPACLVLQDRLGVDVNLLLFAIFFAAERRCVLSPNELREADDAVALWRTDIVQKLRQIRTYLKTGVPPGNATESLRVQVKAAELKAEQIEQAVLMDWLNLRQASSSSDANVDADKILQLVLDHTCAGLSCRSEPLIEKSIKTLRDAIAQLIG